MSFASGKRRVGCVIGTAGHQRRSLARIQAVERPNRILQQVLWCELRSHEPVRRVVRRAEQVVPNFWSERAFSRASDDRSIRVWPRPAGSEQPRRREP